MKKRKKSNTRKKKKQVFRITRKELYKYIFQGFLLIFVLIVLLFLSVYTGLFGPIPTVKELSKIQNYLSSEVYSQDNVLLGRYYFQDRTRVAYSNLPEHLINGLIATEDARFYQHSGIDGRSVLRVLFKTILLRKESAGGGSTLHQQLAKNLFPRKNYAILTMPVNKFREMIVGVRLNKAYGKKDLIELYLNTVSFGENTYGIETASLTFFAKKPVRLKTEESALLVGMLKGTHYYNPRLQPEKAVQRRNLVLRQMQRYGYLEAAIADSLSKLPLKLNYVKLSHNEGLAPYFREHLRMEMMKWCRENPKSDGSEYNIYTDGLKIYTTINSDLQRYAEQAVSQHMKSLQRIFDQQWKNRDPWGNNQSLVLRSLEKTPVYTHLKREGLTHEEIWKTLSNPEEKEIFTWNGNKEMKISTIDSIAHYLKFLHAGLISVEAQTGYIRAWVGGIKHRYFQYDHVTSRRQAGSTIKPVIYSAALEAGRDPCTYIPNDSMVFEDFNNWNPRNADREFGGFYSMKGGLTHSVNTISVHLLEETGRKEVIDLARELGLEGNLPEVPSLALGTCEASVLEMVEAYSIFLNEGRKVKPVFVKRIEDKNGNVLYESHPEISDQLIRPETADMMLEMMRSVVDHGTASSIRSVYQLNNDLAGKTGTTQDNTDGWFIGLSPVLITGVWVGGDHPVVRFRWGGYGQGAAAALPVYARYMQKIYSNPTYSYSKNLTFEIPDSIKFYLDCEDFKEESKERIFRREDKEGVFDLIKKYFQRRRRE